MSTIGPAAGGAALTPADNTPLDNLTRGLWVGAAGDVHVTLYDQTEVTLKAVPAGTLLPLTVRVLWSTGTTAADIVGLW